MVMDVMVDNVPEAWGISLSCEWVVMVGGSIEMDISYVVIIFSNPQQVRFCREDLKLYLHGMNCNCWDLPFFTFFIFFIIFMTLMTPFPLEFP